MADFDYYGADYGAEEPSRVMEAVRNFGFANWAGALTSLGLTAGMAVWAIDLTFRDVSGVPVIAALEGPMRVAPNDPGGTVAPFQGMALSDITSGGVAAPAPDQIVLAPPPVTLNAPALAERMATAEASQSVAYAAAVATSEADEPQVTPAKVPHGQTAEIDLPEQLERLELASVEADEDQVLVGASAPVEQVAVTPAVTTAPSEPVAAVVSAKASGISQSSRPRQRPAGQRPAALRNGPATVPTEAPAQSEGTRVASIETSVPDSAPAPVVSSRDVDPSTVKPGTRVVQLGAFGSESVARSEWDRLEGRFRAYMVGKGRMIQKANSGGRDFWRLRVVGFDDSSDARRFCAELLAKDAACIPVTVR